MKDEVCGKQYGIRFIEETARINTQFAGAAVYVHARITDRILQYASSSTVDPLYVLAVVLLIYNTSRRSTAEPR